MSSFRRSFSGNLFRSRHGTNVPRPYTQDEVSQGQAQILRTRFGAEKCPSEALRSLSGTSERAARNHLSGATSMNLKDFFNACQNIPELRAWGARMMGLATSLDPAFEAELQGLIGAYFAFKERTEAAE